MKYLVLTLSLYSQFAIATGLNDYQELQKAHRVRFNSQSNTQLMIKELKSYQDEIKKMLKAAESDVGKKQPGALQSKKDWDKYEASVFSYLEKTYSVPARGTLGPVNLLEKENSVLESRLEFLLREIETL